MIAAVSLRLLYDRPGRRTALGKVVITAPNHERTWAMAARTGSAIWTGDLQDGSGRLVVGPQRWEADYSFRSRFTDDAVGSTNPEELLAAAHASCYAMAFSHALSTAGNPPERLHVTSVVSLNPKEGGGVEVTDSALQVSGSVPGLDQAGFQEAAEAAEQGCPISNAIRNNVAITVTATLD